MGLGRSRPRADLDRPPSEAVTAPPGSAYACFPVVTLTGQARLLAVWISGAGCGEPFPRNLREGAHHAVKDAYRAAAVLVGRGLAPRAFHDHQIEITTFDGGAVTDAGLESVDGTSIGLAAFVAFARLWHGQQARHSDAVFTGAVEGRDGEWSLRRVDGVETKLHACESSPFYIPLANATELTRAARAIALMDLRDVLVALGLHGRLGPTTLRTEDWRQRVKEATDVVRFGTPAQIVGRCVEPWTVLSLHMERLLQLSPPTLITKDRCRRLELHAWMLVARQYGGGVVLPHELDDLRAEVEAVASHGRGLDRDTLEVLRALVAMCALAAVMEAPADTLTRRLDDAIATVPGRGNRQAERLRGRILGTIGRALTRLGRSEEALVHLVEARDHHADPDHDLATEVPRSMLYLAQAQFHAGRLAEAEAQLRAALAEIDGASVAGNHRAYLVATRMFVAHALAKTLAVRAAIAGSPALAREALSVMEEVNRTWVARKFGPAVRIAHLRTSAWLARLVGDHAAAERFIVEIEGLLPQVVGATHRRFAAGVHAEAGGPPTTSGVVD